ncbi:hypothetical protein J6TS1_27960 [Siminovitchia terrae]|uniref:Uncharacterized protein n=1 Tax=Siminovitchia terrae TaxID=1914933 RepID=A0ABQ4KZ91_SIMTE|nr:hypothetical protein J6TS1_27960 [Siminovitchia terrae]
MVTLTKFSNQTKIFIIRRGTYIVERLKDKKMVKIRTDRTERNL